MKTKIALLAIAILLLTCNTAFAQMNPIKSFDFSLLEGKKLLIPTWEASEKYIKKMGKKGKFDKIASAKEKAEYYNKIWKEAMAESSYDATDYEIRGYDEKQLIKSKNKEAILLGYLIDRNTGNVHAQLVVTHPKRQAIARTVINGLDMSEKNDIRLMINMLNESLNTAVEMEEEGSDKTFKSLRNKYKERVVEFFDGIEDKVFLIPEIEHKNAKKAEKLNTELKAALKSWKLCDYEFTTMEEIEKKRVEGDPDSFYWRDFPIYTNNILITYHYNVLLSTDGDNVLFAFFGKKRLTASVLEKTQEKLVKKAAKYKQQLSDE